VRRLVRPKIDLAVLARQRLLNRCHSTLLLCALILLAALAGYSLMGFAGIMVGGMAAAMMLLIGSTSGDATFRQLYGAVQLTPRNAPGLASLVRELGRRADLPDGPHLYLLPTPLIQAMAYGTREDPAVAVTSGLLHVLPPREVAAVLAHEVAHIRHGDTFIMRLAQTASAMTSAMANTGIILLLLVLPLSWSTSVEISPLGIFLLLVSPLVSDLLQLSLSRRREFLADAGAVELTGDPVGMIQALRRIYAIQGDDWERFALRGGRWLHWFRTHPPMRERIARLEEMTELEPLLIDHYGLMNVPNISSGTRQQRLMRRYGI